MAAGPTSRSPPTRPPPGARGTGASTSSCRGSIDGSPSAEMQGVAPMKKWIALATSLIGIIALCALVWFVFPIIGFGEARPFESVWLRLALILFILALYCAYYAYRSYRRHKAARAIESALIN